MSRSFGEIESLIVGSTKHRESVAIRLTEKTRINDVTGCVEWTAKAEANGGYGTLCVGRNGQVRAHRAAWTLKNGRIPDGMYVCHKCDNPKCCNVDHMFLGSPRDNMLDKIAKGRGTKPPVHYGEKHHNAKLSDADVAEIRKSHESLSSVSRSYGISIKTAWRIRNNLARVGVAA